MSLSINKPEKDKKKDKKGKKEKVEKKKEEYKSIDVPPLETKFQIDGVLKLVLSTITQKAIGCVVGEDVTTIEPWIFIKKEKIEDNIELHEESSEFLPLRHCIIKYPEEEILIGFDKPIEDDKQEFFLCSNIAAKTTVLTIIEKQKDEMQERLKQSIAKHPRVWTSLGSEAEVEGDIIQNLRPLIEVDLESKYPLYSEKKKFRLRLVQDAVDGYVEILPGRFPIKNVYRKKIDAGIQVAPATIENEAQTNPTYPKNMWTQYNYEYTEPKLSVKAIKYLTDFINQQVESLSETIHVNEHINLYTDDYMKMSKDVYRSSVVVTRDILSFRDVIACKGKMVSDVSLNPLMSGIIATSYTKYPFNRLYTEAMTEDEINEATFGTNLVLLWCNSDALKPKLYLHSYQAVTKLRFCSFKPNILLGGCANGQIVLWDITGKLEKVETNEILTPSEQKHRLIMQSLMTWMKDTHDIRVVLPTVITSLDFCHKAPVTGITWILPEYEVTRNGKIERCKDGEESMQFMSCGLDGRILVWDLLKKPHGVPTARPKKSQRLEKRPSALTMDISEFRALNNVLAPVYKINIKNVSTTMPYPITCMLIKNANFAFNPLNPETMDDCFQRTYFEPVKSGIPYEFTPDLIVTDKLGNFFKCNWEGHDFDQGQKLNYEKAYYTQFMLIHDGPIRICISNPIDDTIILTVGGRVFALWDILMPDKPLFWRKCQVRYVSGVWISTQPVSLIVSRSDSYFETWELGRRTKSPGRLIRMTGNQIIDQFSDYTRAHVKKMTFITTDVIGNVRVYKSPEIQNPASKDEEISKANEHRKRIHTRRRLFNEWLDGWKKRHILEESPAEEQVEMPKVETVKAEGEEDGKKEDEEKAQPIENEKETEAKADEPPKKKKTETIEKLTSDKWHEKQEKIMYEILLQKKELNLAEIEQHKIPLQKLIEEQRHKSVKIGEILENKEHIFNIAKKRVFKETKIRKRKKFRLTFTDEINEETKQTYMCQYNDDLEETLKYIKSNSFRYMFDWSAMITQGRERRRSLTPFTPKQRRKRNINKESTIIKFLEQTEKSQHDEPKSDSTIEDTQSTFDVTQYGIDNTSNTLIM